MYTLVSITSPDLDTAQVTPGAQVANGRIPVFQVGPGFFVCAETTQILVCPISLFAYPKQALMLSEHV